MRVRAGLAASCDERRRSMPALGSGAAGRTGGPDLREGESEADTLMSAKRVAGDNGRGTGLGGGDRAGLEGIERDRWDGSGSRAALQ